MRSNTVRKTGWLKRSRQTSLAEDLCKSGSESPKVSAKKVANQSLYATLPFGLFYKSNRVAYFSKIESIRQLLEGIAEKYQGGYVYDHFLEWFNKYIDENEKNLTDYFNGDKTLNEMCKEFILFCFEKKISLDADETLTSFQPHNTLSDNAVKLKLDQLQPKNSMNIMGFGLGDGSYEKKLAEYLVEKKLAVQVNVFGFDPRPEDANNIQFITAEQLSSGDSPKFDIITARWVLHHVDSQYRWKNFIDCIKSGNPSALTLIIEHGFLTKVDLNESSVDLKSYKLINAAFDVIANIGIRPQWFTETACIGDNFFVDYLEEVDLELIKDQAGCIATQEIYHLGPEFPNQTFCCFSAHS